MKVILVSFGTIAACMLIVMCVGFCIKKFALDEKEVTNNLGGNTVDIMRDNVK